MLEYTKLHWPSMRRVCLLCCLAALCIGSLALVARSTDTKSVGAHIAHQLTLWLYGPSNFTQSFFDPGHFRFRRRRAPVSTHYSVALPRQSTLLSAILQAWLSRSTISRGGATMVFATAVTNVTMGSRRVLLRLMPLLLQHL